jgi:hypothetical protein
MSSCPAQSKSNITSISLFSKAVPNQGFVGAVGVGRRSSKSRWNGRGARSGEILFERGRSGELGGQINAGGI